VRKLLDNWRFYTLGQIEYRKCMKEIFIQNMSRLRWVNLIVAILAVSFAHFPILIEKNIVKAGFYFGMAAVATFLYVFITIKYNQHKKGKPISNGLIYILLILYYVNIISFGIYLGIWANPDKLAVSFMVILLCALFLFNIPAMLSLCLTFVSVLVFIMASIGVKDPLDWSIDVINAIFTGTVGLIFNWQITMNRMSLFSAISKLKEERNTYYDQSTIDELTKLKNRRDFMATFKRFLSRHRESDNFLCLAIIDIDFFKDYNDYYGHPKGDECLRNIGKVLNDLHNSKNIYVARIGGEEFALLWFEKDAANVDNIASIVKNAIYNLKIPHEKSVIAEYVTISIGIHIVRCDAYNDLQVIYDFADKALYTAKRDGRNRAVISS